MRAWPTSPDFLTLQRFIDAQVAVYPVALAELRQGAKRSHWMWFIFPQIAGLGRSSTAMHFAITSSEEARAYLAHPLLGQRLLECLAVLAVLDRKLTAIEVFGPVDAMKFRSSLTLFEATGGGRAFADALARWFGGERDQATLRLLSQS